MFHAVDFTGQLITTSNPPQEWLFAPIDDEFINFELETAAAINQSYGNEPTSDELSEVLNSLSAEANE